MPIFEYIAIDSKGASVKGTVDQADRASAINTLVKQQLRPVSVQELQGKSAGSSFSNRMGAGKLNPISW
jgi:type II secretory pathway component PulF